MLLLPSISISIPRRRPWGWAWGYRQSYHNFSLSLLQNLSHPRSFNQILSHAIASGVFRDPVVSSKLLYYSLSHDHDFAFSRTLFFQIHKPNVFSWNFMFRAYSRSSFPAETIALYNLMLRNGTLPDNYSFPFVLKACARLSLLHKGREIHSSTLKLGVHLDVFVQNALISAFSSCGAVEAARAVFDMLPALVRDVVSWNSMISGYLQSHRYELALKVFWELLGDGSLSPDEVTLVSALSVCGRLGLLDLGKKIHGLFTGSGFVLDVFVGSSLIDMYSKCGQIEDARKVFDRIPHRNTVCWTSMIAGYAQSDLFKEAIELFREMQIGGFAADAATIACVLSACGHWGALAQGRWIHLYCERNSIEMDLNARNALIVISGLAMNGESDKALHLFSQMEMISDIRPNEITFLGVLCACNHGGFVDKGLYYFNAMTQIYNLTPGIEHYGCMVDLLGRANLLVEAEKFIRTLPIQPDVVIWRSLLFACRNHGNIELAEFAAKQIEELEPRRCGARVLLSNVYASASRWGDVKRVRKDMATQRIKKQPGCSFVEIDGLVHELFVADRSHPEMGAIYETMISINKALQSKGFDPGILDHQEQ
ncbi:pentatricopeptide repeat-containing protein At1g08070, chloroplastic [Vitis vinifera]|uniref:pentatricopeptide repeat-containing protein At1g08070, chloroplastic n=1 Tax=Vitis vinifera TaxID=29760 RepID=UPI0008FEC6D5|nr:pentatricopeptide repeat-containing protein At1g08070, chloroplastic [Vitis vinifera]|eukprot:XP_019082003.1 PREDICTED: pentatricopeptide repeat-containing protein At1g08070, chloroplastic [Vitis vinifera]